MRPASPSVLLQESGLPAFLVSDLLNIRYLTGLSMTAGLLLVTPRAFTLFVDARYAEQAAADAYKGIAVKAVGDLEGMLKKIAVCGFEGDDVTVSRLKGWRARFGATRFVRTSGIVEAFRRQKDDSELKLLRRARRITKEMLRRVPSALRRSITERDLAWKLEQWARELGADGLSFEPIVAFGTHTSRPHHRATTRPLRKGHVVQIDVGAKYRGYCADLSEVFFTAPLTPEQQAVYQAVREAKDAATDAIRPGVSSVNVDEAARKVLRGYQMEEYFPYATGHGVGLDVHEGPVLGRGRRGKRLLEGEVLTVEPGVHLPGKFGIRLEDMVEVRGPDAD